MWCLARAYALAEAQQLAPLEYTGLIWAAMIGFFFFAEAPRPQLWIGAVIIIGACLWGSGGKRAAQPVVAVDPAPTKT
jgi:S-adenosylmethionine uptake transporter